MFRSDNPITSSTEDYLGRSGVAKSLGEEILRYDNPDSLTIGIIGKWGSGKTSFINMVLEQFKVRKDYIVVKFNPWNISTRNLLISDFFSVLSSEIGKNSKSKTIGSIGKGLKVFSKMLKPFGTIAATTVAQQVLPIAGTPAISAGVSYVCDVIEDVGDAMKAYSDVRSGDLNQLKEELDKKLIKSKKKIIIVIDDIDRLTDNEIREIFQLVKSIADFKNTRYILSYDNEIVGRALDKLQLGRGEEYLEKIVQVPILLPHVSRDEVTDIFFKRLTEVIKDVPDEDFDSEYFNKLQVNGFIGNFDNLRDVERYFNTFKFGFNFAVSELNICDFMALTLLKVFEPELYKYIQGNEENFAGREFFDSYGTQVDIIETAVKNELSEILEKMKKLNLENVKNLLMVLFPKLGRIFNHSKGATYDINCNKNRQIASSKYFMNYFKLDFLSDEIRTSELKKIKSFKDKNDLKKLFNMNDFRKMELLNRIVDIIDDIEEAKIVDFLQIILYVCNQIEFENQNDFSYYLDPPKFICSHIFFKGVEKISIEGRYRIIKEVFMDEDCSMECLFKILDDLRKAIAMMGKNKIEEYQLDELLNMMTNRLIIKSQEANNIPKGLIGILYVLNRFEKSDEAKKVFENYSKNNDLLLDMLKSMIGMTRVTQGYKVSYKKFILKDYISDFMDYDKFVGIVDGHISNPVGEALELIGYLKNAKEKGNDFNDAEIGI
ncbi:KAP family P-loop NTPase fold protein [Fusobacterium sp. PH5-44]|uniref:KAP family P-loop NTPase fold protein n=1 Tax=unclassified Fusobacterium TaxID=2648384 RepID=UPI003D1BC390